MIKLRKIASIPLIALLIILATTPMAIGKEKEKKEAPSFVIRDFIDGLDQCITVSFAPDGRLFYLEKPGRVWFIENGMTRFFAGLKVDTSGERGLLGIAFDPDFTQNGFIYFYYSVKESLNNRVVRMKEVGGKGTDETLVLEIEDFMKASNHNGGDIKFGPDNMLYVTVGDGGGSPGRSQNTTNLLGKILRIDPRAPLPIKYNSPEDIFYARGLRNSFRMAWNPYNQTLYATENGPIGRDEINRITEGGNYGWPREKGFRPRNRFINPMWDFGPRAVSPTGITFYPWWGNFPGEYHGNAFITDYNYGRIYRVKLTGKQLEIIEPKNMQIWKEEGFASTTFADITVGPDGALYLAGFSKIVRIGWEE